MENYTKFEEVQKVLSADPMNKQTLDILRREKSATGWSIARMLDQDPEKVVQALAQLRRSGLIDSESGSGLDGFYFLTGLAYQLMRSMAS